MSARPLVISVFLLSASALAYEILLMRLFSIIQWHHFAYMVIGLALLGYGVSGSLVSVFQHALIKRFAVIYTSSTVLFGFTSLAVFLLSQEIPFNAEEILWDVRQTLYLALLFVLLSIPFFFASTAFCLAFMYLKQQTAVIYAADLVGAAFGSLAVIMLLFWLPAQNTLLVIGIIALIAAFIATSSLQGVAKKVFQFIIVIAMGLFIVGNTIIELKISPYKSLAQTLLISGSKITTQRSSPLGQLSVVENPVIPFRHAPGMSFTSPYSPPEQLALFTDGGGLSAINRFSENKQTLAYLDYLPSALPYHLNVLNSALIVESGGGSSLVQGLYHEVKEITALVNNPQVVELVDQVYAEFSGNPYSRPGVETHHKEIRSYLSETEKQFDLIQVSLLEAYNPAFSGLHALHENYLFTTQAVALYLNNLTSAGYLSFTQWVEIPPRESLRLLATAIHALQQAGVEHPEDHLIYLRGWQTGTLLVKNTPFTEPELDRARQFAKQRSFDFSWYPGISEAQVNRYNLLATPIIFTAAKRLFTEDKAAFIDEYKFDIEPATDNKPYFHHFFKWSTFFELLELRNQGGMSFIEWGYLVLITSIAVAIFLSVLLVLVPLLLFYRTETSSRVKRADIIYFFTAIGLAFLMIEITYIQKFILFLQQPIYSISLTLTAFLFFAGLGSFFSDAFVRKFGSYKATVISVIWISIIAVIYLLVLDELFAYYVNSGIVVRSAVTLMLIAPLAFPMGIPFPIALGNITNHAPSYTPWAWAINGCASVVSASLATLLALNFGFTVVIIIALLLYLTTIKTFPAIGN